MKALSKVFGYGVVAAMIFVFTSMACAQLPEGDHAKMGKNWEERFNKTIQELNLTPAQQQAITQQRAQERAQSQELRQKIKSVRDEITRELDKETTDTVKVNALVAQMKELTGNRIEQQIQGIMALKKILSPAQFKALNEKRGQNEKHKGGKR
jgi:Spy/CpxP family protein refolding chaperone